ncbi:Crp/Fnr family transcriptional regulator [Pseudothauera rhizosphaerae]|uniref:Crp/Fnr family transcriptional regulator n=1 Tax=Pseudothauera rhizosphaerae TaxID=2565932 RepID=A0A4S4ALC2_9RHOO|nr:Crp/Fnr family transcriptional regulator [Pseudothauera rhizosphaerae]THF60326.1 Crp/Fnr family transcriptional regulator [Pseudothauera rhizosphaerae]
MASAHIVPIVESLAGVAPFDCLPHDEIERLAAGTRICRFARHEMISHGGRPAEGLYLVLSGEVKRFLLSPNGAEKIIELCGAGQTFGEESALTGHPQLVGCQATRDSVLLLIGTAALRRAMEASAALDAALLGALAERMHGLIENLQLCVQRNSTQRVAHYLAQLAPREADHCEIRLDTDKQTIAAQLNLTPETLSRALNRLTRDGMIRPRGRRGLTLTDVGMLRTCAAG